MDPARGSPNTLLALANQRFCVQCLHRYISINAAATDCLVSRSRRHSTIASPTLLIAGGRDRFYDLALLEETAALIPGCTLSLHPRQGHMTVTSRPRTIAEALEFMSSPTEPAR